MFLFTRQGRLTGGQAAFAWATTIRDRASEVLETEVGLWANTLSPSFGTVTWTTWWSDLGSLQGRTAKLATDAMYLELATEGAQFVPGGIDDGLYQSHYMSEGSFEAMTVASTVRAVSARGRAVAAITAGVDIARRFEAITGQPGLFYSCVTGNYGGVGWLALYEDLSVFETANNKIAGDESWITYLDSLDCYVEDADATQALLYSKIP